MNTVHLSGNIGAEPEFKIFDSGKRKVSFCLRSKDWIARMVRLKGAKIYLLISPPETTTSTSNTATTITSSSTSVAPLPHSPTSPYDAHLAALRSTKTDCG